MAFIWVKVPRLSASSSQDSLWLYYGNSAVADGQEPGATFDTPQLGVYHLGEKEGAPRDSTAYANNAKESTVKADTPALIGRGVTLPGYGEHFVIAKAPSLNISKGFTFSAWVKLARTQTDGRLLSWDDGKHAVIVGVEGTKLYCTLAAPKASTLKAVDLPLQKWVHVAVTAEPGKALTLYTNGQERASQKIAAMPEPSADLSIGASLQGKSPFAGDLDELKIAALARSPVWIRATAVGEGPETPLLAFAEEETSSGGGENLTIHLLAVTARAITLDGWLIIGMILVMVALTWILFFNKFMTLRKVKKDNGLFIEAFSETHELDALSGKEDDFPESSLFRVYRSGIQELERRSGKASEKTISAFRGALNRSSLQESKKNAAGLILFTLSISGGPFMGLFGTVWGVINTFAGVAEAGEANLAAIAPGVASALACTLMGLVLAIPALFQYTYITAEIKHITSDMNVFMTEYTARVEEEYGGK